MMSTDARRTFALSVPPLILPSSILPSSKYVCEAAAHTLEEAVAYCHTYQAAAPEYQQLMKVGPLSPEQDLPERLNIDGERIPQHYIAKLHRHRLQRVEHRAEEQQ